MSIREQITEVRERIEAACRKAGRSAEEVTLIGVSKTKPAEMIDEAAEAGLLHAGENYATEFRDKVPLVRHRDEIHWHFIGHLQTNKVKYVIDRAEYIHSVDSERLLQEIDRLAEKRDKVQQVLLEVNISGELSKNGLSAREVPFLLEKAAELSHVKVGGLMTMAPFGANESEIRRIFQNLRRLSIDLKPFCCNNIDMNILSMGMSNDFELAILEGANFVRVGSAIYGKR